MMIFQRGERGEGDVDVLMGVYVCGEKSSLVIFEYFHPRQSWSGFG